MAWQIQEAKQRFSALVQKAMDDGPQVITRHGEAVVVVLAIDEYERLRHPKADFVQFLLEGPDFDQLDLTRDRAPAREIEL
jgi:prevent-host-death family protein